MQIRKKWFNQLKKFFSKHFFEYYLASFCWWISSSCENRCTLMYNCALYSSVSLPRLGAVLNKGLGCSKRVWRTVKPNMYIVQWSAWRDSTKFSHRCNPCSLGTKWSQVMSVRLRCYCTVFIPLAVTGYVRNITKVLKRCQKRKME